MSEAKPRITLAENISELLDVRATRRMMNCYLVTESELSGMSRTANHGAVAVSTALFFTGFAVDWITKAFLGDAAPEIAIPVIVIAAISAGAFAWWGLQRFRERDAIITQIKEAAPGRSPAASKLSAASAASRTALEAWISANRRRAMGEAHTDDG